jgi:hypothetical protein
MVKELLVTARYTFGPETFPEEPYCWSCMSSKKKDTPIRIAQPPFPPQPFCPDCVKLCNTPEFHNPKEKVSSSKANYKDAARKKHAKKKRKQSKVLPEEDVEL